MSGQEPRENEPPIRVSDRSPGVARIELNRPGSLNAWTPDLGVELLAALREASADDSVRAILLTGASGRAARSMFREHDLGGA